ncbi:cobalt-precorrin-5B (C(1))-methyltransferase CbiD [Roseburia hominis]
MENSRIIWKNQKKLRTGYTTGSCAAAAAKAAAKMLLSGEEIRHVSLMTPAGICLYLEIEEIEMGADYVSCGVKKDSGDDPDVTNGVYVYAKVSRNMSGEVCLDGGVGVGRVTRKGLESNIGDAAINKVPRSMILSAVREQMNLAGYTGGMDIVISIPAGVRLAAKTFNPRLGIEGGISVLGTSGIVEPMSERALTETIFLEMKVLKEGGNDWCYLVPGNYGNDFLREHMNYDGRLAVKCSNYIGEAIDDAIRLGMQGVLLVGHIGKLVKLAAGVMNTHSRQADCRMEVLASHGAMAGADRETAVQIMNCITTTEALELLKQAGVLEETMRTVTERIEYYLRRRAGEHLKIGAVMFSEEMGILGETSLAGEIGECILGEE